MTFHALLVLLVSFQLGSRVRCSTAKCSVCHHKGGKGKGDQLLLCDGQDCGIATHMRCLNPPLTEVCGLYRLSFPLYSIYFTHVLRLVEEQPLVKNMTKL